MTRFELEAPYFAPLGDASKPSRTERGFTLALGDELFEAEVLAPDLLRFAISKAGKLERHPTYATAFATSLARADARPGCAFELEHDDEHVVLRTEALELRASTRPFLLSAFRRDGTVIFEDAPDRDGGGYRELNDAFAITRRIHPHDPIFGLGQKTGASNRRGRRLVLWNTDVLAPGVLAQQHLHETDTSLSGRSTRFDPYYSSIPLSYHVQSSLPGAPAAGFFIDNGHKAVFDFRARERYRYVFYGGSYTEYVFAGPSIPSILSRYTELTGRMPLPPLWSLGHHQCRWKDYTQDELLEIGRQYRARGLPCDALWLDIGYMEGYRVYTWSEERFPDPQRLVREAQAEDLRLVTIIDPGVKLEPGYAVFEGGKAKGLFCKTESGKLYVGQVWPGRSVFPDFSLEEAREFWAELTAEHLRQGIDGIWNDMNEPATGAIEPFSMRFDRAGHNHPHEHFHNQYGLLMAIATAEGFARAYPELRPFILSRAGFAGIQRYAAQWLGDNHSDWAHLELSLPMAAGMGLCGQPFIGADIPGFAGPADWELMVRWMQYGALTPFSRCHAIMGESDQYPWSFGAAVEAICRAALELRYRLLPYLYAAFWQAAQSGAPVQRSLLFEFQDDAQSRTADDCFMLGDALLVAPILQPGETRRSVYLPRGTWYDWHDDACSSGPRIVTAEAPLERLPLFARGGYVIAQHARSLQCTAAHLRQRELELHLYVPLEDGEFRSVVYEDDGATLAYRAGKSLLTQLTLRRRGKLIDLAASVQGDGFAELQRRAFSLVVHGLGQGGAAAQLNGRPAPLTQARLTLPTAPFELRIEL